MISNPSKKRDYTMVINLLLKQLMKWKKLILSSFPSDVPQPLADKLEFGCVEPGMVLKV